MNDDYSIDPTPVGQPEAAPAGGGATASAHRTGTATMARIGLLGIAAAALVAVAILAFGAGAAPTGTLAGSQDDQAATNGVAGLNGRGPGGRGFGHMLGGITVTAISGSSISLETVDGWTRTIAVDDGTTYSKSGDDIALGDLAVGDEIGFRQTLEDDGSWTINAIVVIPPHAGGEVTAVEGNTITVEGRDGETTTITVNAATTYQVNGDEATLADVEVGMKLVAEGTENADGSLTATEVRAGDLDGRGPGRHGFGFGPGFGFHGDKDADPDATRAPSASDSAS